MVKYNEDDNLCAITKFSNQGEKSENGQIYIQLILISWSVETVGGLASAIQSLTTGSLFGFLFVEGLMYSLTNTSPSNFGYEYCFM